MTSHDTRLALAAERNDQRDDPDHDAPVGAPVKYAVCHCTDRAHGYPDRNQWVTTAEHALTDLGDRRDAHVIVRLTYDIDDTPAPIARTTDIIDRLVIDLARATGTPEQLVRLGAGVPR